MVCYLTTLFLGKPPEGSFPVFSANSFSRSLHLALFEAAEEGKCSPRKNVREAIVDLWAACKLSLMQN